MKATEVVQALQAKGYTPTQVVNSLTRSVAHFDRHPVSPVKKAVYKKALNEAVLALAKAHAEGFVPCGADCMEATVDHCVCHCNGKNHGMALQAKSA